MILNFPAGIGSFEDSDGNQYTPNANGQVIVQTNINDFLAAGFSIASQEGATGSRPTTGLYAGMFFFDTTLNKPVWRNSANSGWVDATGMSA